MTQKPTGRPTVMTKATVQKLETALRDGFSVDMACYVSGVSRSAYYSHLASDPDFMNKMTLAQTWVTEHAKQVVARAVGSGNLKAAQWWLERKLRAEFSANPPQHVQRETVSMADQYFGGDQTKYLDFMAQTIEALREPAKVS